MEDSGVDPPPLPLDRAASPSIATTCCVVACGLAFLVVLYVGSYICLVVDILNGGRFTTSLDKGTIDVLEVIYWPLARLLEASGILA